MPARFAQPGEKYFPASAGRPRVTQSSKAWRNANLMRNRKLYSTRPAWPRSEKPQTEINRRAQRDLRKWGNSSRAAASMMPTCSIRSGGGIRTMSQMFGSAQSSADRLAPRYEEPICLPKPDRAAPGRYVRGARDWCAPVRNSAPPQQARTKCGAPQQSSPVRRKSAPAYCARQADQRPAPTRSRFLAGRRLAPRAVRKRAQD